MVRSKRRWNDPRRHLKRKGDTVHHPLLGRVGHATLSWRAAIIGVFSLLGLLGMAASASAATTATASFTAPGTYTFVVPTGVSSLMVTAVGGAGGSGAAGTQAGGLGATVTATVPVSGGEPLFVGVGGPGGAGPFQGAGAAGIGGGGAGGTATDGGGGGGGASLVGPGSPFPGYLPLIEAGGGGGGGGNTPGGNAGADGPNDPGCGPGGPTACSGRAGTATAGGLAGVGAANGVNGNPGALGLGGNAANGSTVGAGGGGGGLYGGGGGGSGTAGGSGGGGSSYAAPGDTGVSSSTTSNPSGVTITYAAPTADANSGSLTFPGQVQGTSSPEQSVTITNNGSAPLVVSSAQVGGANPGDYQVSNRCQQPVAAGATCQIGVRFDPQAQGASAASLMLSTNAASSPTITLSGTGTAPTTAATGPQGPAGPQGQAGAQGPVGPRGPAGTIVCQNTLVAKALCTLEFAPGSFSIAGGQKAMVEVFRAGHIVVRGELRTIRGTPVRARLGRLAHGHYTLLITARHGARTRDLLRLAFTVR